MQPRLPARSLAHSDSSVVSSGTTTRNRSPPIAVAGNGDSALGTCASTSRTRGPSSLVAASRIANRTSGQNAVVFHAKMTGGV